MSGQRSTVAMLHIATPEGVTFSLRLAGPVTRALSLFIDFLVTMAISEILQTVLGFVSVVSSDVGMASQVLSQFVLSFGYGSICEILFNGQTLGKRILGIRVMDERGFRLRPSQVLIRNLVRIVDMLPLFYAVGGVFCLFSSRNQRVGDLAAGTIVVRDLKVSAPNVEGILGGKYNSFRKYPHLEARLRQKVSPDEAQLALAALVRCEGMDTESRIRLFTEMTERFRTKVKFPDEADFGLTDEQYVRNVVDSLYRHGA